MAVTDGTATGTEPGVGEMKRSLTLTGITVNAMALIAPGAFLWTTFQLQAAQAPPSDPTASTAAAMWPGLLFALVLALLTAYSYAELARAYPDAGTGSSYYFAEAALLEKEKPSHRRWARTAKLSVGWMSHLYYWMYPGIMVAFTATLFGYIYTSLTNGTVLGWGPLAVVCVVFAVVTGYIAFRGISGSTMTSIVINVIQIVTLLAVSVLFVVYRLKNSDQTFVAASAGNVIIPDQFINVLFQGTIAILLLVGFESVTALGAEAKRPDKDVKRGVLLSLLIQGGICYLIEYFAANFAVGTNTATFTDPTTGQTITGLAASAKDPAPIGTMLTNIGDSMFNGGKAVSLIVAVTVLIALIGTTLACLNTGVRVTYSMAKDKEMPSILGLLHGRYATPHGGVWILVAVSALLGIYGANPDSVHNVTRITLASNFGTFLVYGFTCGIAVTAFSHRHDRHWFKHYVVPILGAASGLAPRALECRRRSRARRAARREIARQGRVEDSRRRGTHGNASSGSTVVRTGERFIIADQGRIGRGGCRSPMMRRHLFAVTCDLSMTRRDLFAVNGDLMMVLDDIPAVCFDVPAALRRLIVEQNDLSDRRRDIAANRCHVTVSPDDVQRSIGHVAERDRVLTTRVNDLPSTFDDLPSTFDDLPSTFDDLPSTFDDLPSTFDDLPSTFDDLPSTFDDLPSTFDDLPSTFDDLPSTFDDLPSTFDDLPSTFDDLPSTFDDLPSTFDDLPSTFDDLPSTFDDLPSTFDDLPSTFDDLPSTFDDLPSTFDDLPSTFDDLPSTFDDLPSTFDDLPSTFDDLLSRPDDVMLAGETLNHGNPVGAVGHVVCGRLWGDRPHT